VSKLPAPPSIAQLRAIKPTVTRVRRGATFARIYYTASAYPVAWNDFRYYGPTDSRFDHHLLNAAGAAHVQPRGILYAAETAQTCLAEVFQSTRMINRTRDAPWLDIFDLAVNLTLVVLTGTFATKMGASTAIHSGPRSRARAWAQALYLAYPQCHGLLYCSSMNGNAPAIALTERAIAAGALPRTPRLNRALADAALTNHVYAAASELNYTVL